MADLAKRIPEPADLMLCRHLLIHVTLERLRVLRNFQQSGSRYLMITNQPHAKQNEQIMFTDAYRAVNLYLPLFNFPQPVWSIG